MFIVATPVFDLQGDFFHLLKQKDVNCRALIYTEG